MKSGHATPRARPAATRAPATAFDGTSSSIIDLSVPRDAAVEKVGDTVGAAAGEASRLAALEDLLILDTAPEEIYEELVATAAELCGVPIALVSLVDRSRQWFKAKVGLCAAETPRNVAFCDHAIRQPDALFIIEDAQADPRFADNPLVTGDPFVRFYAGAPLVTAGGDAIGTLCVIDSKPRRLTAGQQRALKFLARQAVTAMDARRRALEVARLARDQANLTTDARLKQEKGAELLELVLQSHELGLWDLDVATGRWTTNAREQEMLGYRAGEADPHILTLDAIIHPDDWPTIRESMAPHLRGEVPYYECTHRMRHRDGHWLWILNRAIVVARDEHGAAARIVGTHVDVTERRRIDAAHAVEAGRRKILLEEATELILVVGRDLRLTEANHSFATALGHSFADVMNLRPWDWNVHFATEEAFVAQFPHWPSEPWRAESQWRRKDGSVFDVEMSCTPVNFNGDEELMMVCRDITQAKLDRAALDAARKMLEQTAAMAQVGGWEVDLLTNRITWSAEVYRIHEVDPDWVPQLQGAIDFYAPEARPLISAAVAEAIATGKSYDLELPLVTARGRHIWVRTLGRAECENGCAVRLVGAFQDITDRRAAQDLLVESERRLRGLADNVPALFSEVGADGCFRFANANYNRWFGVDVKSLIGKPLATIGTRYLEGRNDEIRRALAGEHVVFERDVKLPVGMRTLHSTYVPHFDAEQKVAGFYALTSDITELKETQRKLETLARVDPLTGLGNRRQFDERMPEALARARRSGRQGAVFYLDVDRFKAVNDSLGHGHGDTVLRLFAERVQQSIRETDFVARHAGDEFVAIVESVGSASEARALARKILTRVRATMPLGEASVSITTSIGIALFDGSEDLHRLLERADAALYVVKERGRDGFEVAPLATSTALRDALQTMAQPS